MRNNIRMFLVIALFVAGSARAGHKEGNGGDHVRSTFMKVGRVVLDYLTTSDAGQNLVKQYKLDIAELDKTLSIDTISVSEEALVDNGGAFVDALGEPGKVVLSQNRWVDHFEKDRDIYYLVFHEMLRSAKINDDNYVISKFLDPFPASLRIITRISTQFPILGEDSLVGVVDPKEIAINGSGCPLNRMGMVADLDFEKNQMDLVFRNYTLRLTSGEGLAVQKKSCGLAIPIRAPKGKRVVFSQVDMSAKTNLSSLAQSAMAIESFLPAIPGKVYSKKLKMSANQEATGRLLIRTNEVLKTDCGGQQTMRINSTAQLNVGDKGKSWLDVDRMTVSLKLEACN